MFAEGNNPGVRGTQLGDVLQLDFSGLASGKDPLSKEGKKVGGRCRRQPYPSPLGGSRGWRRVPSSALRLAASISREGHRLCPVVLCPPRQLQVQKQLEQSQSLIRRESQCQAERGVSRPWY